MKSIRKGERGQSLVEYAIVMGIIGLVTLVAVQTVGARVVSVWNSSAAVVQHPSGN